MNRSSGWNDLLRMATLLVGGLVLLASIYLSFYIKFAGNVPARNIGAFGQSYLWIMLGFLVINILFGTYIFYNKSLLDLAYYTILSQLSVSVYMMALTYAGSWLTFPRSVILIAFFVGSVFLYAYGLPEYRRSLEFELHEGQAQSFDLHRHFVTYWLLIWR